MYSQLLSVSPECRVWSCRWLTGDDTADQLRPDRSHLVIDTVPDFVTLRDKGKTLDMEVVQVWLDPKFPDAHKHPTFRAYVERQAERGVLVLIRLNAREGFTLFAPSLSPDGQWHEVSGTVDPRSHSTEEIAEVISGNVPDDQEAGEVSAASPAPVRQV